MLSISYITFGYGIPFDHSLLFLCDLLLFSGSLFSTTDDIALFNPTVNADPPTLAASTNNFALKTAGISTSPIMIGSHSDKI